MSWQKNILLLVGILLGGNAAQAAPRCALQTPVWSAGERGILQVTEAATPLSLTVSDGEGQVVWRGKAPGVGKFAVPVRQAGYYTLAARADDEETQCRFAVTPRRAAGAAPFALGVCTHFAFTQRVYPENTYDILEKMGVDAVRDELFWGDIEPEAGKYVFPSRYADYVGKLAAHHLKLLWVAGYGVARYGGRKPSVPEGTDAFGRYCAAVLRRFGKQILAVEIYNEPNDFDPARDYLPLLQSSYRQIRAAGFTQPVVAVGGAGIGGGMNPDFATKLFDAGGAAFCDGFSQHPYMSPSGDPDAGYATHWMPTPNANLELALGKSAELLHHYGKTRGGWVTELGWPAPTHVSERKQAAFTVRSLLGASRFPHMDGFFFYDFQDDGPDPANKEHRFGLVQQDLSPKPAYQAYAVAANFLRGKRFVRRIAGDDSLLTANLYQDEKGHIWAACWTLEVTVQAVKDESARKKPLPPAHLTLENNLRFRILPDGKKRSGYDWQGRPLDGRGALTASSLPLYLDLGKVNADAVRLEAAE